MALWAKEKVKVYSIINGVNGRHTTCKKDYKLISWYDSQTNDEIIITTSLQ